MEEGISEKKYQGENTNNYWLFRRFRNMSLNLSELEPEKIIWNFFSRKEDLDNSPGLQYHLLPKSNDLSVIPLIGDMFDLFFQVWEPQMI